MLTDCNIYVFIYIRFILADKKFLHKLHCNSMQNTADCFHETVIFNRILGVPYFLLGKKNMEMVLYMFFSTFVCTGRLVLHYKLSSPQIP